MHQIPAAQKAIVEFANSAKEMFPQDLVITIQDNKWALNKPEPFIVALPESNKPTEKNGPKNLIILSQNGTIDDLNRLDTIILVNAKNVLVRESAGFRAYPLENLPNGTIDRNDFDGFIAQALQFAKMLPYALVAFIFVGSLLYFALFQGSNVLTFALLIWLVSAIIKTKRTYTESARITAHTATLPMLIMLVSKVFGFQIPIPMWFELTNIIFAIIVLVKLNKNGEIEKEAASIEAK
jgi:hypothetical protein